MVKSIKLPTYLLIAFILFSGCGSNSGKKGNNQTPFPNYGLKPGDVINIQISSPNIGNEWSGNTGTSGTSINSGNNTAGGTGGNSGAGAVNTNGTSGTVGTSGFLRNMTIDVGTDTQLSAVAYDINGTRYPDVSVEWSSSNAAVATVKSTGEVTAVSPGNTIITAKMTFPDGPQFTDKVGVTVLPSPVNNLSFQTSNISLPQPMWDHASALWNGYLYVSGGNSSCDANHQECGFTDKVYYAPINQDGTIGKFILTSSLPRTLRGHSMLAYNNYMYLIGGIVQPFFGTAPYPDPNNFQTVLNEKVYYAKINTDGSIGGWNETTPLPIPAEGVLPEKAGLFAQSAAVQNGYIYVTGGWNVELKKNVKNVLIGPINEMDGSIKPWIRNETSDLPYDVSKHTTVAASVNGDNYLYVIGGNSGGICGPQAFHREIYYAKINATDGITGRWILASNILPVQLIDHATVAIGRYLIVLGGRDGDDNWPHKIYPDVYCYYITDTGDLDLLKGSLAMPTTLPLPLFHHAAASDKITATGVINIYVTGGASGDTEKPENRKDSVYFLVKTNP